MPSSLIIVALVVAWLLVLVPIVARRRQEVARTADSMLAARVVHSGGVRGKVEEVTMLDVEPGDNVDELGVDDEFEDLDEFGDDFDGLPPEDQAVAHDESPDDDAESFESSEYAEYSEYDDYGAEYDYEPAEPRPYRPGRGGFDPEAAAVAARAKYAGRQRVVVLMLLGAVVTGVAGGFLLPVLWVAHALIDIGLVGYLVYLRRQVRIEEEIRERRTARLGGVRRAPVASSGGSSVVSAAEPVVPPVTRRAAVAPQPGAVVVDADDEDPIFAELEDPGSLPYRRAVGE